MVSMIKIKVMKTLSASFALCALCLVATTGCATNRTAQTEAPPAPKPLNQIREIPDGGLSPVAEPPQTGGTWGNNFMPPGN